MYEMHCKHFAGICHLKWHYNQDSGLEYLQCANVWTRELHLFLQCSVTTETMGTSPDFHKYYKVNTKFPSVKGTKYLCMLSGTNQLHPCRPGCQRALLFCPVLSLSSYSSWPLGVSTNPKRSQLLLRYLSGESSKGRVFACLFVCFKTSKPLFVEWWVKDKTPTSTKLYWF